jgi:hypothetical protein
MHHQSRTLLILTAVALAGVWALGYGAQRYATLLEGRQGGATLQRAAGDLEGFIAVRRAMRREIDSWSRGASRREALVLARDRAMVMHRVDPQAYAEMRRLYRSWREGRLEAGTVMASALERRRQELTRVDLGDYESLDS